MLEKHICKIDGCTSKARRRGRCKKHYRLWRKENPPSTHREPEVFKDVRINDYWYLWKTRLDNGELCDEWLDREVFARGVQPRIKNHALCRIDDKKPYGPDNFVWRPKIRRMAHESMSDYALRLRIEQLSRHPDFERDRTLMRNYRLTQEQYNDMLKKQNHGCAICKRPESSLGRDKKLRKLAVDHCHETKMIRGLLCFKCNTALGKFEDSVDLLQAAIAYVEKHKPRPDLKIVSSI